MNPYTVYISGFSYYFLEERNGFISRQIVYFGYSQDVLNDDGTTVKHISNISSDSDTSLDFTTSNLKVTDTATVNSLVVGKEKFSDIITNKIAEVVADAPEDFDTLKEISDWISSHEDSASAMNTAIKTNKTDITSLQESIAGIIDDTTTNANKTYSSQNIQQVCKDVRGIVEYWLISSKTITLSMDSTAYRRVILYNNDAYYEFVVHEWSYKCVYHWIKGESLPSDVTALYQNNRLTLTYTGTYQYGYKVIIEAPNVMNISSYS